VATAEKLSYGTRKVRRPAPDAAEETAATLSLTLAGDASGCAATSSITHSTGASGETSPTMHWAVTVPTRSEQRVSLRGPSASEPQQRKGSEWRGDCADWRSDCGPSRDAARPGEAGPRSAGPRSADAFCSHCSTARRLHLSLYPSPGSTHENSSSPVGRRCRATALPSARGCQRQTDSRTDGPIWTQRRTRQRESTMRATSIRASR